MTFSERQGLKPIRQILQTNSMGAELRSRLWNVLRSQCLYASEGYTLSHPSNADLLSFCRTFWDDYFKRPTDTIPQYPNQAIGEIRQYFFNCEWYEVYDLIEFVASRSIYTSRANAMAGFNEVLASELSAYRFVGSKLAPISSEQEMLSIERAFVQTADSYSNTSEHLQQAISLLARKPTADYRNSIKESISAVEALCAVVTGHGKATLGQALKVIDTEAPLHGALRSAFEKLYGYTSDADGIRHALMEETSLKQEDAIFMLVACSAFVSYVIAKRARKSSSPS
jgi:hypothetical protein